MMDIPQNFVEEIDFKELNFIEIVGRGAFGVVSRAKWRGIDVAVKHIETASEKKAFITELKQLSRVCHTNIVTLYGACTKSPVCLVMEYAEGGSLYNVLHGNGPVIEYTLAHALNWCLQCAKGVEYLHNMKPKALIHRDLKPPNLLLVQGGTLLKICDFGTACDLHTYMTNNKGSAAWMAPEVFEGSNYSEKCDVFSWSIILWEVLTRRKPFEEIGGPAFRIMWAVHHGTRPPLIANCPKPLETLMTKCWSSNPVERPSMAEIARVMSKICQQQDVFRETGTVIKELQACVEIPDEKYWVCDISLEFFTTDIYILASVEKYVTGADEPLIYPNTPDPPASSSTVYDTPPPTFRSQLTTRVDTHHDTVRAVGEPVHVQRVVSVPKPVVVEDEPSSRQRMTSAPASLAASRESLLDKGGSRSSTPSVEVFNHKRYSADLTKLEQYDIMSQGGAKPPQGENSQSDSELHSGRGHRRTGSHGSPYQVAAIYNNSPANMPPPPQGRGHRRTGSHGNSPLTSDIFSIPISHMGLTHTTTAPASLTSAVSTSPNQGIEQGHAHAIRSMSWTPGLGSTAVKSVVSGSALSPENVALNLHFNALDHQLQPLAPCPTSQESMDLYEDHVNLAKEYMRVQVEIGMLLQRKNELNQEFQQDERDHENSTRFIEEYAQLVSENEQLLLLHNNLKKQVEMIRQQQPVRGRLP